MPQDAPQTDVAPGDRAVTLPETLVVFETEITSPMRAVDTKKERHAAAWHAILRSDPSGWRSVFDREPARRLKGLDRPLTKSDKTFKYVMAQESYLKVATYAAIQPYMIIATDGTKHSAAEAVLVAAALDGYRSTRAMLDVPVRKLLQDRVDPYLAQLVKAPPDGDIHHMLAAQAAERISEKLMLLDPRAILALVERGGKPSHHNGQVVYSHRRALWQLENLEQEVDLLLSQSTERTELIERGAIALGEAIPLLQPFGRVWQITEELKNLAVENRMFWVVSDESMDWVLGDERATASRGLWRTPAEKMQYDLFVALRNALRSAGANPHKPIADFNGRKKAFIKAMGPVMQRLALRSLADLRVRLADADRRGHQHYEGIYNSLLALTEKRGLSGAADAASNPEFPKLAATFPLMGYPPFAKKALVLFAKWSDPARKNWTMPRARRFANEINSDLVRHWGPRAKRADKEIREKDKVWLADALIPLVLDQFGVGNDSFLVDVALAKHEEVKNDISLRDILVAIISVALAFIPGGGVLVTIARAVVTGYDVYALNEEKNDFLTANALFTVGQASKEPSEFGVILGAAALGIDLPEFARMLGKTTTAVRNALKKRELVKLGKAAKSPNDILEEFYEAYLRQKRAKQIKLLWKAIGKAQVLGATPVLIKEVAAFAKIAGEIGLKLTFEKFSKITRNILNGKISDKLLREAYENSTLSASVPARVFDIDRVHEGVKALDQRSKAVDLLEQKYNDLTAKMEDALDRFDDAAFDALGKKSDQIRNDLAEATIDLGHSTQLKAVLEDRIEELESQLKLSNDYFSAGAQYTPTRSKPMTGNVNYRRFGEAVYDQKQYLELQLKTLRQILAGTPLTPTGRWMAHETFVTDWLRRQFDEVGYQVKVEVFYTGGGKDTIYVDNLVRLSDVTKNPRFRIYDAKFFETPPKGMVSQGMLRSKLSQGPQERAYMGVVNKQIRQARVSDPRAQSMFGISQNVIIDLDPELVLVLNTRAGPMQDIVLKPK